MWQKRKASDAKAYSQGVEHGGYWWRVDGGMNVFVLDQKLWWALIQIDQDIQSLLESMLDG